MAADWWQQEPDIDWLSDREIPFLIPGRPEPNFGQIEGARLVTRQVFESTKKEFKKTLETGGTGGPGSAPPNDRGGQDDKAPDDDGVPDSGGLEACAFYVSFRYSSRRWGIYVGLDCWWKLAKYLHKTGIPAEVAVDEAFYILYRHEYFHFEVDTATAVLERLIDHATRQRYDLWFEYHHKYNPSVLEEALANAYSFEHSGKRHKKYQAKINQLVGSWMKKLPTGYKDFMDVLGKNKGEARSQLLSEITGIARGNRSFVGGLQPLIRPRSFNSRKDDPLKLRYQGKKLDLYFFERKATKTESG